MDTTFTSFDAHTVIYAKHWYKTTTALADLKVLISKICLADVKHVSDVDVVVQTGLTLHKVLKHSFHVSDIDKLYKDVFEDFPRWTMKTSITMEDVVKSHLRVMATKMVSELPEITEEPNPEYLPLVDEDALNRWQANKDAREKDKEALNKVLPEHPILHS